MSSTSLFQMHSHLRFGSSTIVEMSVILLSRRSSFSSFVQALSGVMSVMPSPPRLSSVISAEKVRPPRVISFYC